MSTASTPDLIVVGSGIIGLATAWRAWHRGMSVQVIDAAARPTGASIQNFGHACFTAQADAIQTVASLSRQGWVDAAAEVGLWAATPGTILPATTEIELEVLREFASHRGEREVLLLNAEDTCARLGVSGMSSGIIGGANLPRDMRVNPREAAPALAEWLASHGVTFTWNTSVFSVSDGCVHTSRGEFRAAEVVVCPGHHLSKIFPDLANDQGVRTCVLTMASIDRPDHISADLAMLTGTSMARYDGLAAMPSATALRAELADREPELVDCVANLMVTGMPDPRGGLFIGDSHSYSDSPEPFIEESTASLLLDRASRLLGIDRPVVRQRWQGRYADSSSTNLVLHRPDDRTTVAVVTSGIGMTLSFGIASLIINHDDAPTF
ncbi:TIGR03364 family FAD-dependent oxidoreductase [Corynebacterium falsenii]|uniref:TIGR03364 family FAD-dependent oxidoreductase n=1 Tax=Corynebacterium falsenii TaxID=108486 RepID=UPI001CD0233E|nr:TIGR03364 family FAD-dependent oxidoreductase [Corynebacterium falsenii]UBI07518.1 TIGR03364 family FAD-dependent oxidoreductase [Corynebacterium falsenii]